MKLKPPGLRVSRVNNTGRTNLIMVDFVKITTYALCAASIGLGSHIFKGLDIQSPTNQTVSPVILNHVSFTPQTGDTTFHHVKHEKQSVSVLVPDHSFGESVSKTVLEKREIAPPQKTMKKPKSVPTPPKRPASESKPKTAMIARNLPVNTVPFKSVQRGNISGAKEVRFDRPRRIRQWDDVYIQLLGQTNDLKHCVNQTAPCNDPVLENWAKKIAPLKHMSRQQKIDGINKLVNEHKFRADRSQYGMNDYWAPPNEFLAGAGDCEDYSILKFASLMALDINNNDLRLVVGNIKGIGSHAFLAVKTNNGEILLDNRTNHISKASSRFDFEPKHSMNFTHRWVHIPNSKTIKST